jgi:hypothetical protein
MRRSERSVETRSRIVATRIIRPLPSFRRVDEQTLVVALPQVWQAHKQAVNGVAIVLAALFDTQIFGMSKFMPRSDSTTSDIQVTWRTKRIVNPQENDSTFSVLCDRMLGRSLTCGHIIETCRSGCQAEYGPLGYDGNHISITSISCCAAQRVCCLVVSFTSGSPLLFTGYAGHLRGKSACFERTLDA